MLPTAQIGDHAVLNRPTDHARVTVDPDSFAPQDFATSPKIFDRRHIPLFERDGEIHGKKHGMVTAAKLVEFLSGGPGIGQPTVAAAHNVRIGLFSVLPDKSHIETMNVKVVDFGTLDGFSAHPICTRRADISHCAVVSGVTDGGSLGNPGAVI